MEQFSRREWIKLASSAAALPLLPHSALSSVKRTFNYGPNSLDWYPAATYSANAPTLIYVHGGAWALGNRGQVGSKPEHFTRNGYNFASVSYTLFPKANVQTQALQVASAINWIHTNAQSLNADPGRIALMGHSAGCHLSSLATLTGAAPPVKALVCNDTRAYDLGFLAKINGGRLPMLYKAPFTKKKMWSAWSPISYTGLQEQPPTLIAWSRGIGRDRVSRRFADTLEQDGAEVQRHDGKRHYTHISIDRRMGSKRDTFTKAVDRFLDDVLNRNT